MRPLILSCAIGITVALWALGCSNNHIVAETMGYRDRVCIEAITPDLYALEQKVITLAYKMWRIPEPPDFVDKLCNIRVSFLPTTFGGTEDFVRVGIFRDGGLFSDPKIMVSLVAGNIFATLLHELGHAMGIDYGNSAIHSSDPRSVMYGAWMDGQMLLPLDIEMMAKARKR